jgi:hypothetical protein
MTEQSELVLIECGRGGRHTAVSAALRSSSVQADKRCKMKTVQWHCSEITRGQRPTHIKIVSGYHW